MTTATKSLNQANEIRGSGFKRSKPEQDSPDLGNPQVQHEITHPAAITVLIGDESVELHPLAARKRMALIGLVRTITRVAAQEVPGRSRLITLDPSSHDLIAELYLERLVPLVASATKPPGEITQQQQIETERFVYQKMRYEDIPGVYKAMNELNDVWETINASFQRETEKK